MCKTFAEKISAKKLFFFHEGCGLAKRCSAKGCGRFPQKNWAVNRKCKEMAHVLSGAGILVVEGKKFSLKQDDVVLIDIGEKYYWEGKMRLGIPCSPAWFPEQHEEVER